MMQLFSLAVLVAIVVSSTPSFSSNFAVISPSTQVLAQSTDTRKQEADRLLKQGNKQFDTSQFAAALRSYQQALQIFQSIKDRKGEGNALNSVGLVYLNLGNYHIAIDYHNQSLIIAQEIKDQKGEAYALGSLGNAYRNLGEYKRAIDYHNQQLAITRKIKDQQGEEGSLIGLGLAYRNLGEYQSAINYYKQSLVIARQIKDRQWEGRIIGHLGNAYNALEDYQKAIDYHKEGLVIARQVQDLQGEAYSLSSLGNAYLLLEDYQTAIDYHKQSLKIKHQIKDRRGEAASLCNLGIAYNALGDYQRAIDYQNQSLAIKWQIKDRFGEAASLNNLAAALLNSGNPKAAEENLRHSIAVKEAIRKDLGDNDALKISIFETQAHTYRLLQQVLIAQNRTKDALEIAEQGRARALIELLAVRQQLSSAPASPNIKQIQQIAKQQNATLVEYSIAWDELYIWVVKPTGEVTFQKVDIKKTNLGNVAEDTRTAAATLAEGRGVATNIITGLVNNTRAAVTTTENKSPENNPNTVRTLGCRGNACLQQMYKLLIQPIAKELPTNPDSRVIFIPHESLFLVPFAALQDQDKKFLIEKHTISIAPSIQALELTRARRLKLQQAQISALVVGNPTMPKVSFKIGEPPQQLDSLPGAETEAKDIAVLFKVKPLTGKDATKAAVIGQMSQARIIHLATHGLLDELGEGGIPGQVALAPAGKDNGLLSANEVLNLKLNAELVVLSACDTGRGRITGDGVIGLSRAFISAGTPSVIVSLWRVGDNSAAVLMPEFYRQLQKSPNKAQALRRAMLNTMKNYPNPSDWAAFLLVGEAE
ncbi:CHAT domain-containing protein [Mastigocladus laminosus UU774]|nr:CHAT domain-containing protein [Mastigocladus laminosus UU774]